MGDLDNWTISGTWEGSLDVPPSMDLCTPEEIQRAKTALNEIEPLGPDRVKACTTGEQHAWRWRTGILAEEPRATEDEENRARFRCQVSGDVYVGITDCACGERAILAYPYSGIVGKWPDWQKMSRL